ncbi:Transcriptional regulator, IclR family [Sphingobium indicum BiD32]|uniref:Transcriptional regulator, IclR family n=1 Tax=Sphingobium indicum BiD32 TaxID=1301087 RepID=N1MPV8_9SPHN|nr:IclR family transcriptional regulator [Sphingobium indicum]CCW19245.1 Transcriptional regulator, IclR family [Sphingobium indicum BiD32]
MTGRKKASNATEQPRKDAPTYLAPALEKGIDIIELLTTAPQGLTISDIAQKLDRSISELFRVVVVLARRGWLAKDDGDRYRVAYHLLDVAHRATLAQELLHVAMPHMHILATDIRQSCHLVVPVEDHGLIVARQENPGAAGFALRVGTHIDLVASCSGRVLLAFMDDDARREALGSRRSPPTAELAAVKRHGRARMESRRLAGVLDLGCPVFGFDGRIVAALTVPYLTPIDQRDHPSLEESHNRIEQTAQRISRELGWAGGTGV